MQVTLVHCSPRLGKSYEKVFMNDLNGSKTVVRTWNIMKQVVVQDLKEPMKMVKKCGIWRIQVGV